MAHRHTMGNDYGGRARVNPQGAPLVSRSELLSLAARLHVKIIREGPGWSMWKRWDEKRKTWFTLGTTNYMARQSLLNHLSARQYVRLFYPRAVSLCGDGGPRIYEHFKSYKPLSTRAKNDRDAWERAAQRLKERNNGN